jgi:hypothetical protein
MLIPSFVLFRSSWSASRRAVESAPPETATITVSSLKGSLSFRHSANKRLENCVRRGRLNVVLLICGAIFKLQHAQVNQETASETVKDEIEQSGRGQRPRLCESGGVASLCPLPDLFRPTVRFVADSVHTEPVNTKLRHFVERFASFLV